MNALKRLIYGLLGYGLLWPTLLLSQQQANSDRWEPAIHAFEAKDREHFPAPGGVLFIGSSSIAKWTTVAADMAPLPVIHRGFGGSQLSDALRYCDRIVLPYKPADIILYEGDNDIASGKSPEQVFEDYRRFVSQVHARLPEARIHFISIKPSVKRRAMMNAMLRTNTLIEGFCASDKRLYFIDVWKPTLDDKGEPRPDLFLEDMLHLNAAGYVIWTNIIKPHLTKVRAGTMMH